MISEYVYCPRLFYFEQVEGRVRRQRAHSRVDKEGKSAPEPDEEHEELVVVRSITSSSGRRRVIAKLDLAELTVRGLRRSITRHGCPMMSDDGVNVVPTEVW